MIGRAVVDDAARRVNSRAHGRAASTRAGLPRVKAATMVEARLRFPT
jgi:hypothetical protein